MGSGTPKSIKKKLQDYLETNQPPVINEAVWKELLSRLAPVSETYLRDLLHKSGLPFHQPWAGIEQHSFEQLEKSLLDMLDVYRNALAGGDRDLARYCRRVVIAAKDRAKFMGRDGRNTPEKKARKEEMAAWMLVWLEDPEVFPPWVEARKKNPVGLSE